MRAFEASHAMTSDTPKAYWNRAAEEMLRALDSRATGLPEEEARARLEVYGPNTVRAEERYRTLALLRRQIESPLVLILVFAALVSLALRDWVDATLILVIVCASAVLGFLQERRASNVMAFLSARLALTSRVRRDGATVRVPSATLVPGDIVSLSAGDLVPADGVLLDAEDFLVVESSLTGEAMPVEKRPGIVPTEAAIAQRTNCVFLGGSVRSGTATLLVVATGRDTVYGAIVEHVGQRPPDTEFTRGMRQFGYTLLRIMTVMVLFVLLLNLLFQRPAIESMLYAVALAVGLSPELLPAIVSVTLSSGARRMAQRGVLVRRLEAIENLGSMDVLCTDKTGTLTEGVIALEACVDIAGRRSETVRQLAYLNASLETGIENPLDVAIINAGPGPGGAPQHFGKIDEIPYDFQRKRLTIVVEKAGGDAALMIVKGAFDPLLAACSHAAGDAGPVPLDTALRDRLQRAYRTQSTAGYRVLGVAMKTVARRADYDVRDEVDLCFEGFLIFLDRPKASAPALIDALAELGVRLKVISGDNRYVTGHLAASVGLDQSAMLTGEEIGALSDEALWQRARETDVFVEVDPHQKERIVRALQRTGHVVGYLGDGINDAPALHTADVGISVEGAVDVARESADILLLGPDLDVLRSGIEDGRRAFANTMKYISVTTSANFGNMISMALGTVFLPFLPLLPKQILLNNLISDMPCMALGGDAVDSETVARPARWSIRNIRNFMLVFGMLSTAFDLLTFLVLRYAFDAQDDVFRTAWFVLSLITELVALLTLRTWRPVWRSMPRPLLLGITVAAAFVAIALPYLDALARALGFVPLGAAMMAALLAIVGAYGLVIEIFKARVWPKVEPSQWSDTARRVGDAVGKVSKKGGT